MALKPRQELAVVALSQGQTRAQAAASVGAGLRTVQSWCVQPEFQAAVCQGQREAYSQSIGKLVACSAAAVNVLAAIASDRVVSPSTRVAACKVILDSAYRGFGMADLEGRIAELEARLKS